MKLYAHAGAKKVHFRPSLKKRLKRDIFHHKLDFLGRLELVIVSSVSIQWCTSLLKLLDAHSRELKAVHEPWTMVSFLQRPKSRYLWGRCAGADLKKGPCLKKCEPCSLHIRVLSELPFSQVTLSYSEKTMPLGWHSQRRNLMVLAREKIMCITVPGCLPWTECAFHLDFTCRNLLHMAQHKTVVMNEAWIWVDMQDPLLKLSMYSFC